MTPGATAAPFAAVFVRGLQRCPPAADTEVHSNMQPAVKRCLLCGIRSGLRIWTFIAFATCVLCILLMNRHLRPREVTDWLSHLQEALYELSYPVWVAVWLSAGCSVVGLIGLSMAHRHGWRLKLGFVLIAILAWVALGLMAGAAITAWRWGIDR